MATIDKNILYQQPLVTAVAPDAIVYVDQGAEGLKHVVKLKQLDVNNEWTEVEIDVMNFVSDISVSKGVDKVPGDATISLRAPKHMSNNLYINLRSAFYTMQEVQIYMKGRFLDQNEEPKYYPTFWGVISNISESKSAGDMTNVTLTCQDMMRWLQITKVNMSVSAANSSIEQDPEDKATVKSLHPFTSIYVGVSSPGIIKSLFDVSTSAGFLDAQNIMERTKVTPDVITGNPDIKSFASVEDQAMELWREKFDRMAAALYIYGYAGTRTNPTQTQIQDSPVRDVDVNPDAYNKIFGFQEKIVNEPNIEGGATSFTGTKRVTTKVPLIPLSLMFPYGSMISETKVPAMFQSTFEDRLSIANKVKDQIHLEFFQDMDGSIVLKPQLYNLDVRENLVYVIEDIDIINFNVIEDESQIVTRVDVTGSYISGMSSGNSDVAARYGFAIDANYINKYGMRVEEIGTNFITDYEDATTYARRELARRNSLMYNGSLSIQGRPELKLGYPIFIPSKDIFCYITGIQHSFSFGGSFDTTLSLTAFRHRKYDADGELIKNLFAQLQGSESTQANIEGKEFNTDDNFINNLIQLCDPNSSADAAAERPNYRSKSLDEIMKYQGSFRYTKEQSSTYDPRTNQQLTDNEGYELLGAGFPYAKDLKLTVDFKIIDKVATTDNAAENAQNMEPTNINDPVLFQQPLSLDQLQLDSITVDPDTNLPWNMKPSMIDNKVSQVTPQRADAAKLGASSSTKFRATEI